MKIAATFEKIVTDVAAALFVYGVNVIGDTGALVVSLVKGLIPSGG